MGTIQNQIPSKRKVLFSAQPGPQSAFISCPIQEIFFGGARGGGKTFVLILDWVDHSSRYGDHAAGIIFRKTYNELEEVVKVAKKICHPLGGKYVGQDMRMPNGSVLKFRHLNRDDRMFFPQCHGKTSDLPHAGLPLKLSGYDGFRRGKEE